jgi:N-acyl-D-amino-acid deacylase
MRIHLPQPTAGCDHIARRAIAWLRGLPGPALRGRRTVGHAERPSRPARKGPALVLAAALAAAAPLATPQPAGVAGRGLLIANGTLVDGTGAPARRADVRVEGDRITAVAPGLVPGPADAVIDAAGLIVAPGFVDMHSHASRGLAEHPGAESQIRQGITTVIVGQDGSSDLPVGEFFDRIERARPALNVATLVGAGTVRSLVLGADSRRAATPREIEVMQALVDRAMRDGALGLSSGLEYDPGFYATPEELVALAAIAAQHGGFYASHVRDEEHEVFAAWREAIEVGRRAGAPVLISHIKLGVKSMWGRAAEGLRLLEEAARSGVRVMADWYPYTFWQSSIYVLIPDRDFENEAKWRAGLDDIGGAEQVLVTNYRPDPAWNGRTLAELARASGKDPAALIVEMVRAAGPDIGIIGTSMDERDLETFVRHPQVLVGSDGQIVGPHPRGYGTFPRVLARYVRERKLLTLEEAVAKMSGRSAAFAGLADRGLVAPGRQADIVLFDPEAVLDLATKEQPARMAAGIEYVIVNGEVVLERGRPTGARPGRALRRLPRPASAR